MMNHRFRRRRKKVGLALSGGAARGQAHIGVFKVLQENDIPIDFVAGTSAGSLVGALICAGYGWEQIADLTETLHWTDLIRPQFSALGLVSAEKLEKLLDELIAGKEFDELEIPFRAVAVDVISGDEVVFDSGSVAYAVRASSSIPGIFAPVAAGEQLLVDGGVRNNIPADVVQRMGADVIISVDVNYHRIKEEGPENLADVILASMRILMNNNKRYAEEISDILIRPNLAGFNYYDLRQSRDMLERGEAAALEQLGQIRRTIATRWERYR